MACWTHVAAVFRIDALGLPDGEDFQSLIDAIVGKEMSHDAFGMYDVMRNLEAEGFEGRELWHHPDMEAVNALQLAEEEDIESNPDSYLPHGSEGSLRVSVWKDDGPSLAKLTVTVFGDLRDYGSYGFDGDLDDIEQWFSRVVGCGAMIRQAVCTADDEGSGKTMNLTYDCHSPWNKEAKMVDARVHKTIYEKVEADG